MTIQQIIEEYGTGTTYSEKIVSALSSIFDFDFPIFDESYRSVLETKILKHYYHYEICEDTVAEWKILLDALLNEIMPLENKRYNTTIMEITPLYNYISKKTNSGSSLESTETTNESTGTTSTNTENTGSQENNVTAGTTSQTTNKQTENVANENVVKKSDTPMGQIENLTDGYITEASKSTGETATNQATSGTNVTSESTITTGGSSQTSKATEATTATTEGKNNFTSTTSYVEDIKAVTGVSQSELLEKFRNTLIDIDCEIILALKPLFDLVF